MVYHTSEKEFEGALNKKFSGLDLELQRFVTFLNDGTMPSNSDIIKCRLVGNVITSEEFRKKFPKILEIAGKTDAVVTVCDRKYRISLKSGESNSVHQEKWEFFETKLRELNATSVEIETFRDFIHSRIYNNKYFPNHQPEKKIMQNFLDKNCKALLTHFIKKRILCVRGTCRVSVS